MNKRYLITGGAGLIGSHLADQLVRAGAAEVVILDNLTRGTMKNLAWAMANGPVTFVQGDIADRDLLNKLFAGIDTVFHMAAIRITHCADDPRLAHEVLGTGTFNVLEAAVKQKVRKVVASSSASIYGAAEVFPTREDHHPYNNTTLYGAAKSYLEGMLRSFHHMYGLDYVALRYFNVYGPRMDTHGAYTEVMIRWMERIVRNEPPLVMGDGSSSMDFVYVEDVARANVVAAQSDVTDEVFNVASGVETTLKELALAMLKVMHSDLGIEMGFSRKTNIVPRRLASTEKARSLLGYQTEVDLDTGLARLVDWWRGQRAESGGAGEGAGR